MIDTLLLSGGHERADAPLGRGAEELACRLHSDGLPLVRYPHNQSSHHYFLLFIIIRMFLYVTLAVLGIIVIPFAIFYYEAEDEKGSAFPINTLDNK